MSRQLHLDYPFFTVIAAIFTMENSVSSSYKAGIYRMIGSLAGAVTGLIFIQIEPGNALLMGIGTLITIYICDKLSWSRAIPIAGVMFAAIMLSLNNKDPVVYILSRLLNTAIGIAIAVAVNYIIFPPRYKAQLRSSLHSIFMRISEAAKELLCSGISPDIENLRSDLIAIIKFIETYKIEFRPKIESDDQLSHAISELESLRNILSHLKIIDELSPNRRLSPINIEKLQLLWPCEIETGEMQASDAAIVYNYHAAKILDLLPDLILDFKNQNIKEPKTSKKE